MRAIKRAEHRGDYALACALLIRRDNRRATLAHYSDVLVLAAWLPAVGLWAYLAHCLMASV